MLDVDTKNRPCRSVSRTIEMEQDGTGIQQPKSNRFPENQSGVLHGLLPTAVPSAHDPQGEIGK